MTASRLREHDEPHVQAVARRAAAFTCDGKRELPLELECLQGVGNARAGHLEELGEFADRADRGAGIHQGTAGLSVPAGDQQAQQPQRGAGQPGGQVAHERRMQPHLAAEPGNLGDRERYRDAGLPARDEILGGTAAGPGLAARTAAGLRQFQEPCRDHFPYAGSNGAAARTRRFVLTTALGRRVLDRAVAEHGAAALPRAMGGRPVSICQPEHPKRSRAQAARRALHPGGRYGSIDILGAEPAAARKATPLCLHAVQPAHRTGPTGVRAAPRGDRPRVTGDDPQDCARMEAGILGNSWLDA
jgi:hypothetical protein